VGGRTFEGGVLAGHYGITFIHIFFLPGVVVKSGRLHAHLAVIMLPYLICTSVWYVRVVVVAVVVVLVGCSTNCSGMY